MSKVIKYENDARNSVVSGIDAVANIVKTTIGPKGRNVLIRNQVSSPIITNDGVTIAKSIQLKDNAEDAGAQLIISAANKTNEAAGDGTTTTTILAQEMIHQYFDNVDSYANENVVQLQKDMVKASNEISDYLLSIAKPVNDNTAIERVATISSGSDITGKLIADAFEMSGDYGSVIVEDSKTGVDMLTNIQGMKLTNGMVTQYLFTDRANRKSDIKDVEVLVTLDKLDNIADAIPLLDDCVKQRRKLLLICDDIDTDLLNAILMNKAQGALLNLSIIRLPGFGELREQLVEDICLATGSTLMGRDRGITLRDYTPEYLGEADQIIVTLDDTIIKFKDAKSSDGTDLLSIRKARAEEIETIMNSVPDDQKEQYKRRISNLLAGISAIQVGGNSEVEIKDKKLRLEDAINSVKSAKEEGIVPGGGFSFLSYLMNTKLEETASKGVKLVYNSLKAVTKQIAENAGFNGEDTVNKCFETHLGFNALTGEYEDLINTGVINSVKVDRYSLLNAASLAATVITMGGMIVEENEKDQNVLQLQTAIPNIM